jgi:putative copper resistance protein D
MTMSDLPPYSWHAFFHSWHLNVGWLLFCVVVAAFYLSALHRAHLRGVHPVHPIRIVAFLAGLGILAWCLCSSIDVYAMALFWVHMIEHLTLITVVPALLVVGHPLTALRAAGREKWQTLFDTVVRHRLIAVITSPFVGLVVYSVVIVYTHLTPFMDEMTVHPWLMSLEQILYLLSGWMLLVGTIGEEPIRWQTPYLLRLVLLVMAMIPDTLVGIVLLQTTTSPFPVYMGNRPTWATSAVHDLDIGGSLMWAAGDFLMMSLAIGIIVSVTAGSAGERLLGPWLESARTNTFVERVSRAGVAVPPSWRDGSTIDDDDALDAYNDMLQRMRTLDEEGR